MQRPSLKGSVGPGGLCPAVYARRGRQVRRRRSRELRVAGLFGLGSAPHVVFNSNMTDREHQMIDEANCDGDGEVSDEEFTRIME